MPFIRIVWERDRYSVQELSEESADAGMQQGQDFPWINQAVLDAWAAHCKQDAVFDALWQELHKKQRP